MQVKTLLVSDVRDQIRIIDAVFRGLKQLLIASGDMPESFPACYPSNIEQYPEAIKVLDEFLQQAFVDGRKYQSDRDEETF